MHVFQKQKCSIHYRMYKSEFAKECSKSRDSLNDIGFDNMKGEDDWFSHDKFKEILEMKEKTICRSMSSSQVTLHSSPLTSKRLSNNSRLQSMLAIAPPSSDPSMGQVNDQEVAHPISANNIDRDELKRLEVENYQLRRQLEMLSRSDALDSKYANLATEAVRLQNSVSQVRMTNINT